MRSTTESFFILDRMAQKLLRYDSVNFVNSVYFRSGRRNFFPAVAKHSSHPDQLIQKFVQSSYITLIEQFSVLIENLFYVSEINVPKNCDQTELAHHW